MAGLRFGDPHALRAALPLVPAEVQAAGGLVVREADAGLVVVASLPAPVRKALLEAGATASKATKGEPFVHWAALVPLEPDPNPAIDRQVLFCLPPGAPWLPLAAELVRLGCDRVSLTSLEQSEGDVGSGHWALKVERPPYYTIAKASPETWQVFAPQGRAWVEVGFVHPFASRMTLPRVDGQEGLVLIGRSGWRAITAPVFTELATLIDLVMGDSQAVSTRPPGDRLAVTLRLASGPRAGRPVLWSVPEPVDASLAALVRDLPDTVVERLSFARFSQADGSPGALIRARPGSEPPLLEGLVPYAAHRELPSLFVPDGRAISPPLRGRTLAAHLELNGSGQVLVWLVPGDGGGFSVRQIEESAFHPLADHVLYEADGKAEAVKAWLGSTLFDWEPLDLPIAADPRPARERQPRGARSEPEQEVPAAAPPRAERSAPVSVQVNVPMVAFDPGAFETLPAADALEEQLFRLQQASLAEPDRADLWIGMALIHHATGALREAALCWTRAIWDASSDERRELAKRWSSRVPLPHPLPEKPTAADCAAVVAHLLAEGDTPDPATLQRFFDAHDRANDPRTRWLGRRRIAALAGNDVLALARAKDLVFQSIRAGLSPARDVPGFLRTSATPEDLRLLAMSLAGLPERFERHIPKGKDAAPVACTRAYARLTVAWAQAALGLAEPVPVAIEAAAAALPAGDPVHQVLLGLYRSGIDEALQGLPAETPPPPDVLAALEALPRFERYKVERLREQSVAVLTQTGARNAFSTFLDRPALVWTGDPMTALRAALDGEITATVLLQVLDAATGLDEADAAQVLEGVVAKAGSLEGIDRVHVLVEAVSVAAMLRRSTVAAGVLGSLTGALVDVAKSAPETVLAPVRGLVRSLARCDLDTEADTLLSTVHDATAEAKWIVRLRLTGARAQVGGDVGNAIEQALGRLATALPPNQFIAVVAATADLSTGLPVKDAVGLWERLVPFAAITDQYSTNTHFALSFLQVVELIAAAHVHPDRLLGPEGRARLDADEQRIRLRIHREDRF